MSEDISVLWEYTFWELFFQSFFKHSQVEQIHVKKKKQPISNFFFECEDKHGEWGGGGGALLFFTWILIYFRPFKGGTSIVVP